MSSSSSNSNQEYLQNIPATLTDKQYQVSSIGCFLSTGRLELLRDGSAYTIPSKYRTQTVYSKVAYRVAKGDAPVDEEGNDEGPVDTSKVPQMSDRCTFRNDRWLGRSTGFLVYANGPQDIIIATAGHCVFETGSSAANPHTKRDVMDGFFVFGLTQDRLESGTIPLEKVFGVDRVLFGQNERFEDMFKPVTNTADLKYQQPGPLSLDKIDRPDWALVRLRNLGPSTLPAYGPLSLAAPEDVFDGLKGAWLAGHPWGSGLKIAVPPKDRLAVIRTIVPSDQKTPNGPDEKVQRPDRIEKDYKLVNVFRHNIRATSGNSGSPVILPNTKVAGILASNRNESLNGLLYQWNNNDSKSLIEPYYTPDTYPLYSNATKTSTFSALLNPTAKLLLVVKFFDEAQAAAAQGRITLTLVINRPNAPAQKHLFWSGQGSEKAQQFTNSLPADARPANITAIEITYNSPASMSIPMLESLQLVVTQDTKPDELPNPINWIPLYESGAVQTLKAGAGVVNTIPLSPWLPKEWKYNLVAGPKAIPGVTPQTQRVEDPSVNKNSLPQHAPASTTSSSVVGKK